MLNRRSFLQVVCVSLLTCPLVADAQAPAPTALGWLGRWRLTVLSFGVIEQDTHSRTYYKVVGTGIVFIEEAATAYIVTAKHVFFDPDRKWHPSEIRVRWGWQERKSVYDEHGLSLPLRDGAGNNLWTALPDGSDLAAIRAPAPSMKDQPAAPLEVMAKTDEIFEGQSVVVLGFPGIVGNEYLVRAVVRGGVVAWLDPAAPFESPFLIDANIYPGNSGGPVIKVPTGVNREGGFDMTGRPALLGIVSKAPGLLQEIEVNVPGGRNPLRLRQQIPLGGTGVVEPVSKVRRLLDIMRAKKE